MDEFLDGCLGKGELVISSGATTAHAPLVVGHGLRRTDRLLKPGWNLSLPDGRVGRPVGRKSVRAERVA